MKILQLIYTLAQGGAERFVLDLSNKLSENHEVYLLLIRDDSLEYVTFFKEELNPKVNYRSLKLKAGFRPVDHIKIFKLIKNLNPDVVHCHLNTVLYTIIPSIFLKKTKYFHTIHNDSKHSENEYFSAFLKKILYQKKLVQPITISDENHKSFEFHYKFKKALTIYNGRKRLEKSEKFLEVQKEINTLKNSANDLVFLHVARFHKEKNQQILINVFNRLISERQGVILLIIGMDFDTEGQEIVKSASDGIHFLGGRDNVADYFLNSDAFCLSSLSEGMPISLIEALACNCIPICTPVGGIVNIIENNVNGFLSKDTGEASYYLAVKEFIKGKNNINKKLLNSLFVNNFSIEKCTGEYIKAYTDHQIKI